MENNTKYILNPAYILRNDISRIVLATLDLKDFESSKLNNVVTFIHPMYAALLSFFNGERTLDHNLDLISKYFDITVQDAYNIVYKFINNKTNIAVEYDNNFFYFPKEILIEKQEKHQVRTYSPDDFFIEEEIDVTTMRLNIPLEASILINNRCLTNCIYCYADKRQIHDCTIPFGRIEEIISEAKSLGIISFDIQGGELFLYKHWYELLATLFKHGYSVYLSTKCPLTVDDISKLKELGVKEIQISLDSIYSDDLKRNLKVGDNYHSAILETIKLLNDAGLAIKLKAVITAPIFNIGRMDDYVEYFKQFPNVDLIDFTAPAHSLYKTQQEFFEYRLSESQLNALIEFVNNKRTSCEDFFELSADVPEKQECKCMTFEQKKEAFYRRSKCTGNMSSFIILPNGDMGVCEETYFNKNLIMGNVLNNSILEVWNSERAKNMFFIPQSKFPKESPCSKCVEFSQCRYSCGVCWTDVMAAYGEENWLFPTPECHYAPKSQIETKIW